MLETKVLRNSVISDTRKGACFITVDIQYYFLATPIARAEYMKVKYKHIPEDTKIKYKLKEKSDFRHLHLYQNQKMNVQTKAGRHNGT